MKFSAFSTLFTKKTPVADESFGQATYVVGSSRLSTTMLAKLTEYDVTTELKAEHTRLVRPLMDDLQSCAQQLKDTSGDTRKRTAQFKTDWERQTAAMMRLPGKTAKLFKKHKQSEQSLYVDSMTMMKNKPFLSEFVDAVVGERLTLMMASANLDNFKSINDKWSCEHGDKAIIQSGSLMLEMVEAWNGRMDGGAHCTPFRFGGDKFAFGFVLPVSAVVAPADKVVKCKILMQQIRKAVTDLLAKDFPFTKGMGLKGRDLKPIKANGPGISIGLSAPLSTCTTDVQLNGAFATADELLKEYKLKWKDSLDEWGSSGGVVWQAEIRPEGAFIAVLKDSGATDQAKAAAASSLWDLAMESAEHRTALADAGAIPVLVDLLKIGSAGGKEMAAGVLASLAVNAENMVTAIPQAGAIPALVDLLKSGSAEGKLQAAGALWNLANNDANCTAIPSAGAIPALVSLLRSGDLEGKENAAGTLHNLSANAENQVAIGAAGGIEALLGLLRQGTPDGKEGVASALLNLCFEQQNKTILKGAGGVAALEAYTRTGTSAGKQKAQLALNMLK
jgi:GGDEF domain-containing protein